MNCFKSIIFGVTMLLGGIVLQAGTNLFPIGDFSWNPGSCEVRSGTKSGCYSCSMFLAIPEQSSKTFFFFYKDTKPDSGPCAIELDTQNKYRDAKCSIKFDFSKINDKIMHQASFVFRPIMIEKDKVYTATFYLKSETPGQKFSATLRGRRTTAQRKNIDFYKFSIFTAGNLWQAYQVNLKLSDREGTLSGNFGSLELRPLSAGVFYIGKIVIEEKTIAEK